MLQQNIFFSIFIIYLKFFRIISNKLKYICYCCVKNVFQCYFLFNIVTYEDTYTQLGFSGMHQYINSDKIIVLYVIFRIMLGQVYRCMNFQDFRFYRMFPHQRGELCTLAKRVSSSSTGGFSSVSDRIRVAIDFFSTYS